MSIILLKQIHTKEEDINAVEAEINDSLKKEFYAPLASILKENSKMSNTVDDLKEAIRAGRIKFHQGKFTGKLNANLTKEIKKLGAIWSPKKGAFTIRLTAIPSEIQKTIRLSESAYLKKMSKLDDKLKSLSPKEIGESVNISKVVDRQIFRVDSEVERSLKSITVTPTFSEEAASKISEEYTNNMSRNIRRWSDKEIVSLRKKIKSHVLKGLRYEEIVEVIEHSYGVSKSKALFLARQETSLLVAKLKETRYGEAGVDDYIWKTVVGSPNHPVRPLHVKLNNTRQKFSDPPIIDERTGQRGNPGETYGCRCTAQAYINKREGRK